MSPITALSIAMPVSASIASLSFFLVKNRVFRDHSDIVLTIGWLALVVFVILLIILSIKSRELGKLEREEKAMQALLWNKMQRGEMDGGAEIIARIDVLQAKIKRLKGAPKHKDNGEVLYRVHKHPDAGEAAQGEANVYDHGKQPKADEDDRKILFGWAYHSEEHYVDITAWADPGYDLLPQEAAQIRDVLASGQLDGKPVKEIRVVFPNEEQAARQLAALRELGCRVFYQGATPKELVELT
ncbi:MAG: hypothetical protein Q4D61_06025 [Cardiobacteriaceae bacterium]|nr:hypothetical protein [Cardiobacteriaceae bacterium]